MADIYIEHMVKREKNNKTLAIQVLIAFAALVLEFGLFVLLLLTREALVAFMPLLMAGVIWIAWIMIRRRNFEFEYIVTNADLDVDKIIAKRTRKRLLTVDCRKFEVLAPMTPQHQREHGAAAATRKIDASSSQSSDRRWFALYAGNDGVRTLLIFEPNDKMLAAFKKYIPRKIMTP